MSRRSTQSKPMNPLSGGRPPGRHSCQTRFGLVASTSSVSAPDFVQRHRAGLTLALGFVPLAIGLKALSAQSQLRLPASPGTGAVQVLEWVIVGSVSLVFAGVILYRTLTRVFAHVSTSK